MHTVMLVEGKSQGIDRCVLKKDSCKFWVLLITDQEPSLHTNLCRKKKTESLLDAPHPSFSQPIFPLTIPSNQAGVAFG